jgi:hypothetical protein
LTRPSVSLAPRAAKFMDLIQVGIGMAVIIGLYFYNHPMQHRFRGSRAKAA